VERVSGTGEATSTPVGNVPAPGALDLAGLDLSQDDQDLLLTVDVQAWKREAEQMPEFFRGFGGHLPSRLWELHEELVTRLG
jgi:phosphoenolpyruvate carboxykinase (GTP)